MKKAFFSLALWLLTLQAYAFNPPAFIPNVVDTSGTLSLAQIDSLNETISKLHAESHIYAAVLIVRTTGSESIEQAANTVFEKWELGQKKADNGLLLLAAIDDRKVRIEVGYGLEGMLPDAQASRIIRNIIIPKFKKQDFHNGLKEALLASNALVLGNEIVGFEEEEDGNIVWPRVYVLMGVWVVLIFIIPMLLRFIAVGRAKGYEKKLQPTPEEKLQKNLFALSGMPLFVSLFLLINPGCFFIIFGYMHPWTTVLFALFAYVFLFAFNANYFMMLSQKSRRNYLKKPSKGSTSSTASTTGWSSSSSNSSGSSRSSSSSSSSSSGGSSGGGGASGSW